VPNNVKKFGETKKKEKKEEKKGEGEAGYDSSNFFRGNF